MTPALGDDLLVRRASRRLALQFAGLVAAAMLLLVALVTFVVVRGQDSATDRLLRTTAASADDVGDPPPGAWIVINRGSQQAESPGLPQVLATRLPDLRSAPAVRTLAIGEAEYRILTQVRSRSTVQVVLDLRPQHQERARLFRAMAVAALLSLLVAAGLGVVLGRRAVRPLAQALLLQRTFVADASHELRTPLTLLSTRVQLLDSELAAGRQDQQVLEDARGVVADVHRLGEVVEDLLVAADPRQDALHEPVDLGVLVTEVVTSAAAHARAAGVNLAVALPDDPSQLVVNGSATALRRAVLALVDNAIDHTPTDGRVQLTVRRHRRTVVVAVSDTGPGMSAAAADRGVRRFHSGGQRAGRAHYGLGLALTHDVANRHGGELRLAPSVVGTTFELVLPAGG